MSVTTHFSFHRKHEPKHGHRRRRQSHIISRVNFPSIERYRSPEFSLKPIYHCYADAIHRPFSPLIHADTIERRCITLESHHTVDEGGQAAARDRHIGRRSMMSRSQKTAFSSPSALRHAFSASFHTRRHERAPAASIMPRRRFPPAQFSILPAFISRHFSTARAPHLRPCLRPLARRKRHASQLLDIRRAP